MNVNPLLPDGFSIVWTILVVLQAALFLIALGTIIASPRYTLGGKLLWVVVVFTAPVVGAIAWLTVGRRAQLRTLVP